MEVILTQTIDTLGQEGAVVNVKPGYGRNYLIPQGKAVQATKAAMAARERNMAAIKARLDSERQDAEGVAKKLLGTTLTITMRSGEDSKLYGSVTSADIAEKLAEIGIKVDKRKIILDEPLKSLGEFTLSYKAGYQVLGEFKVLVTSLQAQEQTPAPTAPEPAAPEEAGTEE
ncbi:MAG: 50S ribosomal protein L9 [Desulfurivibrionaceae bacterium]|nr:50S ribosomal protein L9 [Desulfurivibrionaceae bacterium]